MREIAATQASAGLTPALFEAMAEVYEASRALDRRGGAEAIRPSPTSRTSSTGSRLSERVLERRPAGCNSAGERT